jgi:hypothetical protein
VPIPQKKDASYSNTTTTQVRTMTNNDQDAPSIREQIGAIEKTVMIIKAAANKVKQFTGPLGYIITAIVKWYVRVIFHRFAYKDVDGEKVMSNERAATTILSSMGVGILIYFYGFAVLTYFAVLGVDTYKVTLAKEETLYFNIPVYNSTVGFYEVSGCVSNTNCEGGVTSRIFEIKDNHWLDVISHAKFEGGFDPKTDVVSSFSNPRNKCKVLRYRDRSKKYFGFVLNSEIYKARCEATSLPGS